MSRQQMSEEQKISEDSGNANHDDSQSGAPKPPWGDDENFDPERAWSLIQNLREEKDALRARHEEELAATRENVTSREKEVEERDSQIRDLQGKIEDAEKATASRDNEIAALKNDVGSRDSKIVKMNLLSEAGIPLSFVDNVTGDGEDDWKASVSRLASLAEHRGPQGGPDPVQAAATNAGTSASKEEEAQAFFGL